MKRQKTSSGSIIPTVVLLVIIALIGLIISQSSKSVVRKIELSEISEGVYAYREVVVSSIPAQNYTMATVCDKSGNMLTIKGTVNIVSQNDTAPYAVWEDRNIVNGDIVTIYAPTNTVQYLGTVSVGKR